MHQIRLNSLSIDTTLAAGLRQSQADLIASRGRLISHYRSKPTF